MQEKEHKDHARKKSTKINFFWARRPPSRVGGWWPKSSRPPSKVCLPCVSKRGIWDVPGILPGCPGPLGVFEKFVQKKFARIFRCLKVETKLAKLVLMQVFRQRLSSCIRPVLKLLHKSVWHWYMLRIGRASGMGPFEAPLPGRAQTQMEFSYGPFQDHTLRSKNKYKQIKMFLEFCRSSKLFRIGFLLFLNYLP